MKQTIETIVKNDNWAVAEGLHEGKPLVVRFRNEFQNKPDIAGYDRLLIITWNYTERETGLPDDAESAAMEQFENHVISSFEKDLTAVLTAVITINGTREWIFYTRDIQECGKRINSIPQKNDPYPIKLESETDAKWDFLYGNILAGMNRGT